MRLTRWGPPPSASTAPVLLLHGWQDTGDTFQFLVDSFARDRPLVAPDWRGFGRSEWAQQGYWFPDYLADLDALLDDLSAAAPAHLVGHSMGGNVAAMFAGLRPDRVRSVATLEGVGLPRTASADAVPQLRRWLDQVKDRPVPKEYETIEQLAAVIRFRYPRFSDSQAAFVAAAWGEPKDGRIRLRGDARHRWVNPYRYHREDAEACWRQVRAPCLMLLGEESEFLAKLGADEGDAAWREYIPHIEIVRVAGAGHMLHIEKPDVVAPLIEGFLEAH